MANMIAGGINVARDQIDFVESTNREAIEIALGLLEGMRAQDVFECMKAVPTHIENLRTSENYLLGSHALRTNQFLNTFL